MKPGFRGPERDSERSRHLGQRLAQEVVGDDDRTHPGIEPAERPVDLIAVDHERSAVGDRLIGRRRELDLDDAAAPASQEGQTGPDRDPVDPRVEPVGVAQPRQVRPRVDERLLDRVSRELGVPEDQAGRRVQPRDDPADEHGEGVMIAPSGPLDESSLVHRRSPVPARPLDRAPNRTVRAVAESFPVRPVTAGRVHARRRSEAPAILGPRPERCPEGRQSPSTLEEAR